MKFRKKFIDDSNILKLLKRRNQTTSFPNTLTEEGTTVPVKQPDQDIMEVMDEIDDYIKSYAGR
jgi:hypothetical protein